MHLISVLHAHNMLNYHIAQNLIENYGGIGSLQCNQLYLSKFYSNWLTVANQPIHQYFTVKKKCFREQSTKVSCCRHPVLCYVNRNVTSTGPSYMLHVLLNIHESCSVTCTAFWAGLGHMCGWKPSTSTTLIYGNLYNYILVIWFSMTVYKLMCPEPHPPCLHLLYSITYKIIVWISKLYKCLKSFFLETFLYKSTVLVCRD